MSETKQQQPPTPAVPKAGIFQIGHPRVGGRPSGAISGRRKRAQEAMEALAIKLKRDVEDIDPLLGLLKIGSNTALPETVRMEAMALCLPFVYPRLQSQQVELSGPNEGPVNVVDFSVLSPQAIEAAQKLAIAMASSAPAQLPAPSVESRPAPDPTIELEKDRTGNWRRG